MEFTPLSYYQDNGTSNTNSIIYAILLHRFGVYSSKEVFYHENLAVIRPLILEVNWNT